MKKVQITETVLRDANQSLMATRLPYADFEEILPEMDKAGYYSVECWGGATFDSCLRYLGEDPWERLRNIRRLMPNTKLQMLLRGQNLLGYKHYHDDVVEKFVELSIKNGIDILRIFDALNDFRNIKTALEATKKYGGKNTVASGCISYTQSPVHTVEKYVEMCKELKTMGFDTICLKDMAGTMSPYEAEHLIKGIKDAVGDMPLILHTHCTTGMAYMTVTKAIESGIDVIDCATSCFSNGTSQPATETMFYALQQYGIKTGLNEDVINKVNDFFKPVKQKYVDSGRINAKSMATDAQALVYKVPGGMLSNMIANLTDMKAMDKFEAALAEIPAVRKGTSAILRWSPRCPRWSATRPLPTSCSASATSRSPRKSKTTSRASTALRPLPFPRSSRRRSSARAASLLTAASKTQSAPVRTSRRPRKRSAILQEAKKIS